MGKKNYVGIDIGHDRLKLAYVRNGRVRKTASVQLPENLIKNGRVISPETMADLIKSTLKENGIREKKAALLLPADCVYVKNVSIPSMTAEQLEINLPYEFRDYFNEELHDYYYDYAVYGTAEDGEVEELLAAAVRKEIVNDFRALLDRAGLTAEIIAPSVCAYRKLIKEAGKESENEEYCFLDIGSRNVHMNFFRGMRHVATRELESSMELVEQAVSGIYNVDRHVAHTYLLGNFEDCQSKEACKEAYNTIAVEVLRSVNFYQFSNPDSQLKNVYICGGGAFIDAMRETFREVMPELTFHNASELLSDGTEDRVRDEALLAIGIALP